MQEAKREFNCLMVKESSLKVPQTYDFKSLSGRVVKNLVQNIMNKSIKA